MNDANYGKWREVSSIAGVLDLYEYYLCMAGEAHGASIKFNKKSSVAIYRGRPPIISLHPEKSSAGKGLWIGYSRTNIGRYLLPYSLPADFENQKYMQVNNEWRFGFFSSKEAIDKLIGEAFG